MPLLRCCATREQNVASSFTVWAGRQHMTEFAAALLLDKALTSAGTPSSNMRGPLTTPARSTHTKGMQQSRGSACARHMHTPTHICTRTPTRTPTHPHTCHTRQMTSSAWSQHASCLPQQLVPVPPPIPKRPAMSPAVEHSRGYRMVVRRVQCSSPSGSCVLTGTSSCWYFLQGI